VRAPKQLGFEFHRHAAGSHEIWFSQNSRRFTTIPNHSGDLPEGTLRAILRQADVSVQSFLSGEQDGEGVSGGAEDQT
jgi:predicted RNA binding protein YcfA (HicA-like mRNA interferase family)